MSLPNEEAEALAAAFALLRDLSSGAEKRVPSQTRERARSALRHFPLTAAERWEELNSPFPWTEHLPPPWRHEFALRMGLFTTFWESLAAAWLRANAHRDSTATRPGHDSNVPVTTQRPGACALTTTNTDPHESVVLIRHPCQHVDAYTRKCVRL